jgi:hypothetical protein
VSRRPQNGPTFSKPPLKKQKPMTDQELADWQARQAAEQEETKRKAAKSRQFHKRVNEVGLFRALWPRKDNPKSERQEDLDLL